MFPEISEVLRKRRLLGITQKHLSILSGVSQPTIAKIESGSMDPSYSNAIRIFSALDSLISSEGKSAKNIMNQHVLTIKAELGILKAIEIMRKNGISQLPIVDGKGMLAGSISEKGVLAIIDENPKLDIGKTKISSVMEEAFPTVGEKTPSATIGHLLRDSLAIIVIKGKQIRGIITKSDLLKAV